MQRVTNLEGQTNQNRKRFDAYEKLIADRFNEQYLGDGYLERHGEKLDIYMWEELAGDDEVFQEEFTRVITKNDISEDDDIFDPESFYNYINMEIVMERTDDGPEFVRVIKQMNEKDGRSIGIASVNSILGTCMYEVEYVDGYK